MDKTEALKAKILKAQENADIAGLYVLEGEARKNHD